MKLNDIFSQLATNEFSQLSIGGQPRGAINEHNYKQVIDHINLGLTALYSRFDLKRGQIRVSLQPGIYQYALDSKYAVSNRRSREAIRYLLDDAHAPFLDDALKIEQVFTDTHFELDLNDTTKPFGVRTPTLTSLIVPKKLVEPDMTVPDWYKTQSLDVVYRANHPTIQVPLGYFDPKNVTVQLPDSHLTALLYFVASRVNNPIGMSNEFHAGNNYAAKFEAECQRLKMDGLEVDQVGAEDRIRQKGFV